MVDYVICERIIDVDGLYVGSSIYSHTLARIFVGKQFAC